MNNNIERLDGVNVKFRSDNKCHFIGVATTQPIEKKSKEKNIYDVFNEIFDDFYNETFGLLAVTAEDLVNVIYQELYCRLEKFFVESDEDVIKNFIRKNIKRRFKESFEDTPEQRKSFDDLFRSAGKKGCLDRGNIRNNRKLDDYLKEEIIKEELCKEEELDVFYEKNIDRTIHKNYMREIRYKRKLMLYTFNYFVTITYDEAKYQDPEEFRKDLKKWLGNMRTNKNWTVIGCFEEGENGERLHFHAFIYIPKGTLPGNGKLVQQNRYSKKMQKRVRTHESEFVRAKFGINDFDYIEKPAYEYKCKSQGKGNVLNYITKYVIKSGEKLFYSRGIPAELEEKLDVNDVCCVYDGFASPVCVYSDEAGKSLFERMMKKIEEKRRRKKK